MPFKKGVVIPGQGQHQAGVRTYLRKRWGAHGERLFDLLGDVAEGRMEAIQERVQADGSIIEVRVRPTIAERTEAVKELSARLHGRPAQVNVNANVDLDPRDMDDRDLRLRVAEIMARFVSGGSGQLEQKPGKNKALPASRAKGEVVDATAKVIDPEPAGED